jgi:hypothetical protein
VNFVNLCLHLGHPVGGARHLSGQAPSTRKGGMVSFHAELQSLHARPMSANSRGERYLRATPRLPVLGTNGVSRAGLGPYAEVTAHQLCLVAKRGLKGSCRLHTRWIKR